MSQWTVTRKWPRIVYREEGMREGMQIEDANIPVEDKVRLIDALSETGLQEIVVGSFVSPRYTPQMARIEEIVRRLKPRPGVKYTALVLNPKGWERARQFVPPLTLEDRFPIPVLQAHLCDVFVRRNYNRSQEWELEQWPRIVAEAREKGLKEGGIGVAAAFGSNFTGPFNLEERMALLERAAAMWEEAGIRVTLLYLGDPMSWCHPWEVQETLRAVQARWPEIRHFALHLHNARGMALPSAYSALLALDPEDTLYLDGTLGGIGGCPYCGNGRVTGQMATEDLMHMLEGMGVDTGVDLDRLIDCVWMLEEVIGRPAFGFVSKAGPRPVRPEQWYDPNMPFVETLEQAKHFKKGPGVYEGGIRPWREPIRSPQRPETLNL